MGALAKLQYHTFLLLFPLLLKAMNFKQNSMREKWSSFFEGGFLFFPAYNGGMETNYPGMGNSMSSFGSCQPSSRCNLLIASSNNTTWVPCQLSHSCEIPTQGSLTGISVNVSSQHHWGIGVLAFLFIHHWTTAKYLVNNYKSCSNILPNPITKNFGCPLFKTFGCRMWSTDPKLKKPTPR